MKPGDWVWLAKRGGSRKPFKAGQVVAIDGEALTVRVRGHKAPLVVLATDCRPWKARNAIAA